MVVEALCVFACWLVLAARREDADPAHYPPAQAYREHPSVSRRLDDLLILYLLDLSGSPATSLTEDFPFQSYLDFFMPK